MPIDPDRALDYLGFVEARHEAWVGRQQGLPQPWTTEPIVATRKFTNVFRVLDYGSQYLMTDLLDPELDERAILLRCFLYRHTNLPSAWAAYSLERDLPVSAGDLDEMLDFWNAYRFDGGKLFSGAYMIYPQSSEPGTDKIVSLMALTKRLFDPDSPDDIVPDFLEADNQRGRFAALRRNKGVADFMSMQVLTDYGYSSQCGEDREDEFVVCGPGARRGALALDPSSKVEATLEWAISAVRSSPSCPKLGDRKPSAMDIQNTLCEFSKWVRFSQKPLPAKAYTPSHPGPQPEPVLPAHYN